MTYTNGIRDAIDTALYPVSARVRLYTDMDPVNLHHHPFYRENGTIGWT